MAAAIHDGHDTRRSIDRHLGLNEVQRLREEDPYTGEWTQIARTQIVALRSRFEVDFNRPRDKAVYVSPDDAWGLNVWGTPPDNQIIAASLREYDQFYTCVEKLLRELVDKYQHVVVYDLHSYNFQRLDAVASPNFNPEVNIGTRTMDRVYWSPVVDRFLADLQAFDFHGRSLDVRENVKFYGGYFPKWIHEKFPKSVCALAIEFKKFFMDEWTGEGDMHQVETIYRALRSTLPGVRKALAQMSTK